MIGRHSEYWETRSRAKMKLVCKAFHPRVVIRTIPCIPEMDGAESDTMCGPCVEKYQQQIDEYFKKAAQ